MTVARAAAAGALALAVALAVWLLLFRGGGGTEYTLLFQNAGQLVKDDDVQVGGRRDRLACATIELTDDNQAAIKVNVAGALRAAARGHPGDRSGSPRCRASPTATSR